MKRRNEKMKKRKIAEHILFFWIYAVIGWIYEVTLETVIYRWGFSNRGVLFGPWLPVYGFGATVFLILWYRLIKGKTLKRKILMIPVIFLLTMATATLIELITSYLCEWTIGSWPWQTYADYAINFQARIALSPSIRFGIGGVIFLYVIQPLLDRLASKMKDKTLYITAAVIVVVLSADLAYTVFLR
ncbi:MAG: putative ABC transporter permease [Oscillospiraceae bacterium]|nr:putative ABC transporter permease [Oscillospiraceae bacterium]